MSNRANLRSLFVIIVMATVVGIASPSVASASLTQVGPTLTPANAMVETQLMLRHDQSIHRFLHLSSTAALKIEVTVAKRFKCHIGHDKRCMFNTGKNSAGKIVQTDFRQDDWRWSYRVTFSYSRSSISVTRVVTFHELSSNLLSGAKRVDSKLEIVTRKDVKIKAVVPQLTLRCVGSVAEATASIKIIKLKVSAKNKGFIKLKVLVAKYSITKTIVCAGVPTCAAGQIMVGGNCVTQTITQDCKAGEIWKGFQCVAINNNCGVVVIGSGNTVNTGDICSLEICVAKGGTWSHNSGNQTYVCSFPPPPPPPPPPPVAPTVANVTQPEELFPGETYPVICATVTATSGHTIVTTMGAHFGQFGLGGFSDTRTSVGVNRICTSVSTAHYKAPTHVPPGAPNAAPPIAVGHDRITVDAFNTTTGTPAVPARVDFPILVPPPNP